MKLFPCFLFFLILLISGCKKTTGPYPQNNTIYFNSFESAADTAGWHGFALLSFRDDPSPDGGKQSLFISGTCKVPHAEFKIPAQDEEAYYKLQGWGKALQHGGAVGLEIPIINSPGLSFNVSDSVWTFYQSEQKLYCPAEVPMRLSLYSGGIAPAAMLVDQIAMIKIEASD